VHHRAPLQSPALIDALSDWQRARCKDVSVGGVALACDCSLPVGKRVEVYFELPSGVAVETTACVVRCADQQLALRFVSLAQDAELALRAHCRLASTR
jgi:hypothetical protein